MVRQGESIRMAKAGQDDIVYVGVDGGGSRCRVRLRDSRGRAIGAFEGGSANVYLDFGGAVQTIRDCVRQALERTGPGSRSTALRLGLGLAGVSSATIAARVAQALEDLGPAAVAHDAQTACLGAHAGQDGGLIIAGTGSAAAARVAGRATAFGGRGFILGDDGSGARLGLEAWRRALRAHDGLEPHTALTRALMAEFGDDPVAVIAWGRTARSEDFGRYAPMVFLHSAENDPVALDLVRATAAALADLGRALGNFGADRLALVGGLAAAIRPYLPAALLDRLHDPIHDALDGALLLAGCPLPPAPDGASPTDWTHR